MLYWILSAIVAVIIVVLILASTRPADFRVTRTGLISAPPSTVFDHINDMHKWQEWSPWAKMDPSCKITYSGPPAGRDASFQWAGNNRVGEGNMTVMESRSPEFVQFRLEFLKPFKAVNTAEFSLTPDGPNTRVVWSMFGKNNFMSKIFQLFVNFDKIVGSQFEQGFQNLDALVRRQPA